MKRGFIYLVFSAAAAAAARKSLKALNIHIPLIIYISIYAVFAVHT